jgi:hypothetical protein
MPMEEDKYERAREEVRAEHDAEMHKARLAQVEADTASTKAREIRAQATHERELMLLSALGPLLEEGAAFGKAARVRFEYGAPEAIKASACALLVEAARAANSGEALVKTAERLLALCTKAAK